MLGQPVFQPHFKPIDAMTAATTSIDHILPRDKAEILAQALPYIRKFHGKTLVIKYEIGRAHV